MKPLVLHFTKSLKILIVIICTGWTLFGIFMIIRSAIRHPSVTETSAIYVDDLQLPDIGVCSFQPLNIDRLSNELNLTLRQISDLHWHFGRDEYTLTVGYKRAVAEKRRPVIDRHHLKMLTNLSDWGTFVSEYGPQCNDLFISCRKGGAFYDCCEYVRVFVHEKFGNCFQLPRIAQQFGASTMGHWIMFRTANREKYRHKHIKFMPAQNGLVLLVEDGLEKPHGTSSSVLHPIATDQVNHVRFEYTARIKDITLGSCLLPKLSHYSHSKCIWTSWGMLHSSYCGCSLLGYRKYHNTSTCYPDEVYDCWFNNTQFRQANRQWQTHKEYSFCMQLCKEVFYDTTVSSNDLDTQLIKQYFTNNNSVENEYSYTILMAYYDILQKIEYKEIVIATPENVISQLGGQLGMYLGISLVSTALWLINKFENYYTKLMAKKSGAG